jgi:agmatine deiminase
VPRTILPPEWSPQSGVMITWPHAYSDWQDALQEVEPVFAQIALHIARRERLLINCWDEEHIVHVKALLQAGGAAPHNIICHGVHSNDTWTRDYGPLTVLEDGKPRLLDFIFNGWGGKFDAGLDNQVTRHLHRDGVFGRTPLAGVDMVLEGGSIEVDGRGSLLTTANCLLAPTRNPGLGREQIEESLRTWFGVTNILWLRHGHLTGDDTDSHIDTLARFCDAHTIAYVACDDPADEHYAALGRMEAELRACRDHQGEPYRLVPLPWPAAKYDEADGRRLAASYANFLIINGAVLVPTYDDPADAETLRRLQSCFPDRKVIGVPCVPLIRQNGSLHCITMQLPAGVL